MNLVQITWVDAIGGDGWTTEKELKEQELIIHNSVGYVVMEDNDKVTITMSYDADKDNLGAWLCIPKRYIVEMREI